MAVLPLFRGVFGIDLGTANTVVCHPNRGVVLNEPSVMVVRPHEGRAEPVAVGLVAREMMGRTPTGMECVRPLQDGVITDLQTGKAFIVAMLRRVAARPWERVRPRAVIGVPAGATALERQALLEAAAEAGMGRVELVPEPIAGAIGAGLDPMARRAQMVVDIGGGTSEITAFCYGGILTTRSCRIAGDEMTQAGLNHLRVEHQLLVGELAAEELKKSLSQRGPLSVEGRDAASGRPRLLSLRAAELGAALTPTIEAIVSALAATITEELPPQAVADILQDGVVAVGGGSQLIGLGRRLNEAMGLQVRVAEEPLLCVARGAAACLRNRQAARAFSAAA